MQSSAINTMHTRAALRPPLPSRRLPMHLRTARQCTHTCHALSVDRRTLGTALAGLLASSTLPNVDQAIAASPSVTPAASEAAQAPLASEVAIQEFIQLAKSPQANDASKLSQLRLKYGFRRLTSGKVQLRGQDGKWFDLRLDMQLPGVCILRDQEGLVYALQLDGVKQIDLSNDWIIASVFTSGTWQEALEPLVFGEGNEQLRMGALEFRESMGILSEAMQVAGFEEENEGK